MFSIVCVCSSSNKRCVLLFEQTATGEIDIEEEKRQFREMMKKQQEEKDSRANKGKPAAASSSSKPEAESAGKRCACVSLVISTSQTHCPQRIQHVCAVLRRRNQGSSSRAIAVSRDSSRELARVIADA